MSLLCKKFLLMLSSMLDFLVVEVIFLTIFSFFSLVPFRRMCDLKEIILCGDDRNRKWPWRTRAQSLVANSGFKKDIKKPFRVCFSLAYRINSKVFVLHTHTKNLAVNVHIGFRITLVFCITTDIDLILNSIFLLTHTVIQFFYPVPSLSYCG